MIELAYGAGPRRDPRIPWVYVGSSARDAELRFQQHKRGYRSSGLVKRFAVRLRPDLYEDLAPLATSKLGVEAETERARELAACGFVAHSDGTSHGKEAGGWQEWDVDRLRAIASHVERAARDLTEASFESLKPGDCARLLHGERGFWVERFLDPGDPPPAYGLFPHVRLDALERVARSAAK